MRIPDPQQFPVQPQASSGMAFMGTGESIPVLVVNTDPANTIYVGYRSQSKVGDPNTVPLQPGQSVIMDGARTLYVIGAQGTNNALIIPGGTSFFQPTNLIAIGGAKVFVQATAPTGTIPLNSIWFDTSNGSLQTWNGSAWVNQQFNAQQLIQAASILAAQIGNGTLTTTQLAAAAGILGSQIASATITSGNIAANTIVAANIAANTITAAQIAANTITSGNIAANTIVAANIAANTITAAQIAANTITAGQIAANTITAAQLAAGIIYAGIVDGTTIVGGVFRAKNTSGATIMTINKSAGTFLLYQDLGSATQGGLVFSAALASGVDEFSNPFGAGAKAYGTSGNTSYVQMLPGNPVFLNVATGDSAEATPGQIQARTIGSGATRFLSNDLRAAFVTGFPNALAELQLFSVNAGGTTDAGLNLIASNPGGTVTSQMHQTSTQFEFSGAPIIGDRSIEVNNGTNLWLCDRSLTDIQTFILTNPTAATAISNAFTIPANDALAGTWYELELRFNGLWEASGALNLQFEKDGVFTNLVPIAAGMAVAGHNYGGLFRLILRILALGATGSADIYSGGGATDTSVSRIGSTSSGELFGLNGPFTFDTTVAHTLAIGANFSVSNASQTINTHGSRFTRHG